LREGRNASIRDGLLICLLSCPRGLEISLKTERREGSLSTEDISFDVLNRYSQQEHNVQKTQVKDGSQADSSNGDYCNW
jgi:hypothetical protein